MFRWNNLAIHVSPISTPPDLFSSSTRLKHPWFHTFGVRGRKVCDTNVSGLELSVTKHMNPLSSRSRRGSDKIFASGRQTKVVLLWEDYYLASRIMQAFAFANRPATKASAAATSSQKDKPRTTLWRPPSTCRIALDALVQRTTLKQFCPARAGEG